MFSLMMVAQTKVQEQKLLQRDSAIYQGLNLKLDIFTPILEAARSRGQVQDYELALNVRLRQRYYPTLELGYAMAKDSAESGRYQGQGGFFRAGLDINGLKKHVESPHALLVGIRVGTAYQQYTLTDVDRNNPYWTPEPRNYPRTGRWDVWGEVVAGCQVGIASGLTMGWYLRYKLMFTRKPGMGEGLPSYVPGFGYRNDSNWGINYYIGWFF